MAETNFMMYLQTKAANHLVEIILENRCNYNSTYPVHPKSIEIY